MILTNKHGLPDTIVNVLKRPQYSKGDSHVSVTELLSPPQIVQLRAKHDAEIEQDASEMVWSLFGTAVHNVLEHGKDDHHIVEERIFTDMDGWRISGQIDLQEIYEDGIAISLGSPSREGRVAQPAEHLRLVSREDQRRGSKEPTDRGHHP
jgi:hypothetical protein